jgi:hypothetical protein
MAAVRTPMTAYTPVTLPLRLMAVAPASEPRGMADQARTWATLITRP